MSKKALLASASLLCALFLLPVGKVGPISMDGAAGLSTAHAIDIGLGIGGGDDDEGPSIGFGVGVGDGDEDDDEEDDEDD